MAEESAKRIHIEDGNEAPEEAEAAEKLGEEQGAAEAAEAACPEAGKAEAEKSEAAGGKEGRGSDGNTDGCEEGGKESGAEEKEGAAEEKEGAGEEKEGAGEADPEAEAKAAEEQESERYMRLMAEFQNFKRRAAKEKSDIHAFANERIVGDLLPVLDNFERALSTETEDVEAYAKGMELIFEQLKTALEKAGLKEIEAQGIDFDPNVHNAVMTDNVEDSDDGKVTKVLQKGYKLNDRVIRPSMVAVNKK